MHGGVTRVMVTLHPLDKSAAHAQLQLSSLKLSMTGPYPVSAQIQYWFIRQDVRCDSVEVEVTACSCSDYMHV